MQLTSLKMHLTHFKGSVDCEREIWVTLKAGDEPEEDTRKRFLLPIISLSVLPQNFIALSSVSIGQSWKEAKLVWLLFIIAFYPCLLINKHILLYQKTSGKVRQAYQKQVKSSESNIEDQTESCAPLKCGVKRSEVKRDEGCMWICYMSVTWVANKGSDQWKKNLNVLIVERKSNLLTGLNRITSRGSQSLVKARVGFSIDDLQA